MHTLSHHAKDNKLLVGQPKEHEADGVYSVKSGAQCLVLTYKSGIILLKGEEDIGRVLAIENK